MSRAVIPGLAFSENCLSHEDRATRAGKQYCAHGLFGVVGLLRKCSYIKGRPMRRGAGILSSGIERAIGLRFVRDVDAKKRARRYDWENLKRAKQNAFANQRVWITL